jgi:hypothetical protein
MVIAIVNAMNVSANTCTIILSKESREELSFVIVPVSSNLSLCALRSVDR